MRDKKPYFIVSAVLAVVLAVVLIRTDLPSFRKDHMALTSFDTVTQGTNKTTADTVTSSSAHDNTAEPFSPQNTVSEITDTASSSDGTGISETFSQDSPSVSSGKINLNTATADELTSLKGIGEKKAQKIIEYRTLHGGFGSIEEITEVNGIGEKTFENIKGLISV